MKKVKCDHNLKNHDWKHLGTSISHCHNDVLQDDKWWCKICGALKERDGYDHKVTITFPNRKKK